MLETEPPLKENMDFRSTVFGWELCHVLLAILSALFTAVMESRVPGLVIYCCVIILAQTKQLKTTCISYFIVSVGQESGQILAGSSCSGSQKGCNQGVALDYSPISRFYWRRISSSSGSCCSIQFLAGCWNWGPHFLAGYCLEAALIPSHMGLPNTAVCFMKAHKGESLLARWFTILGITVRTNSPSSFAIVYWLNTSHRFWPHARGGDYTKA